jgi:hypothetical protein
MTRTTNARHAGVASMVLAGRAHATGLRLDAPWRQPIMPSADGAEERPIGYPSVTTPKPDTSCVWADKS